MLGCTTTLHTEKVIGAYGTEVRLINSGAEGARAAADRLRERDALAARAGSCRCFVGDRQEDFSRLALLSWAGMWPRRWSRWISANILRKALYI